MSNFKKISKSETVYIEGGYACNKIWLFNIAWLKSVARRENMQLRRRSISAQVETVNCKMRGEAVNTKPILNLVASVELSEFKAVDLSEAVKPMEGYYKGDASRYEVVAFQIGGKVSIDMEFYPALLWDKETTIHVRGDTDPVILVKSGEIVGMISPMNPKNLNNK